MKPKQQITFPDGADRNLLARFAKLASEERRKRFQRNRDALSRQISALPKQPKLDKAAAKAALDRLRQLQPLTSSKKPPKFVPLKGHNPVQYAPFALAEGFLDCGGTGGPGEPCALYGPDATTGEIGANLERLLDFAGEHPVQVSSALSTVGFWFFAPASGTLSVTAQTYLTGFASVQSALIENFRNLSGYSDSRLEVAVEPHPLVSTGSSRTARTSRPTIYSSTKDLFRLGAWAVPYPFGDSNANTGIITTAFESFPDWEGRSVSVLAPVIRFNWHLITLTAYQSIAFGGISNLHIYVGPIAYSLV